MSDKKDYYFTQKDEDAIVEFCKEETSFKKKNRLYENRIQPAFDQLVDKIVYTYKFHNLPNIDDLRQRCKVYLVTILDKYDPDHGSKAFSYFSVCTYNWFVQRAKKRKKKLDRESALEDIPRHIQDRQLVTQNKYEPKREKKEFFKKLLEEIDTWDKGRRGRLLGKNDLKVVKAIRILFNNTDDVKILSKKGVYFHLRHITNLDTKQITRSLNKLRDRYKRFKKDYNKGEIGKEET